MARTCTICTHQERVAINEALLGIDSLRTIADRWSVSKTALIRHKTDHLPTSLTKAAAVAEVVEAGNLLERLKVLNWETAAILREARASDSKDNELALKAIARIEKQIELEGRLLGELNEGATVNVLVSPEWQSLRAVILAALEPYPAARLAIAGALKNAGA